MIWPAEERWLNLWVAIGASGDPLACYEQLKAAYSERHRYYHNQQHIAECLSEFDGVRDLVSNQQQVEMALWFHDAVYNPKAPDNEEKSAALAQEALGRVNVSRAAIERVRQLIMVTKTHEANGDSDAGILIDIDLAILGQGERRFDEYEHQIRQEYAWVPEKVYRTERAKILRSFLARTRIFTTEWFHRKYEDAARRNLEALVRRLADA